MFRWLSKKKEIKEDKTLLLRIERLENLVYNHISSKKEHEFLEEIEEIKDSLAALDKPCGILPYTNKVLLGSTTLPLSIVKKLYCNDIFTIGHLAKKLYKGEEGILSIKGITKKSLKEITLIIEKSDLNSEDY